VILQLRVLTSRLIISNNLTNIFDSRKVTLLAYRPRSWLDVIGAKSGNSNVAVEGITSDVDGRFLRATILGNTVIHVVYSSLDMYIALNDRKIVFRMLVLRCLRFRVQFAEVTSVGPLFQELEALSSAILQQARQFEIFPSLGFPTHPFSHRE